MKKLLLTLLFLVFCSPAIAKDLVYEGPWVTNEGRNLKGRMTAIITDLGDEKWRGRFHGVWHGVKFDYTVNFTGPPDKLRGKATIDGAKYDWKGVIGQQSPGWFKASFTGTRYGGYFDMKQKN